MINQLYKKAGEETEGFNPLFAFEVYKGQPLFHHRNLYEFYVTTKALIESTDRFEYVVTDESGRITASMAIYEDNDMHVGECISVLVAFSTDPHRRALLGGYKWMKSIAKIKSISWIAYTKAISQFEMILKYKKV